GGVRRQRPPPQGAHGRVSLRLTQHSIGPECFCDLGPVVTSRATNPRPLILLCTSFLQSAACRCALASVSLALGLWRRDNEVVEISLGIGLRPQTDLARLRKRGVFGDE